MDRLVVRGAREHNLKDVHLDLPRDALIVFTGLSGSGKSSLAFDTIFAEGQRRYVESLSAYARQFLGQMDKPDVDFIEGLSPAVSIDQKSTNRNPRSTVGTITEVYDYLRLLYARIGKPHCPKCGKPISRQTPQQIVDQVLELEEGTRFQVLAPVVRARKGEYVDLFSDLQTKGFSRARVDGVVHRSPSRRSSRSRRSTRSRWSSTGSTVKESAKRRLTDSVETALGLAGGLVVLDFVDLAEDDPQRERMLLRAPGLHRRRAVVRGAGAALVLLQLALRRLPRVHRHRHPHGGRPGAGRPRPEQDPRRGRHRALGRGHTNEYFLPAARRARRGCSGSRRTPRGRSSRPRPQKAVLHGHDRPGARRYSNRYGRERSYYAAFEGVMPFVERRHAEAESDFMRERYEGYMREVPCPVCQGTRLKPESSPSRSTTARSPRSSACRSARLREFLGAMKLGERERADRRPGAQGDPGPARLPGRRRPRLPLPRPRRPAPWPAARRSASGWPPRSAPAWSACSTSSTSPPSACTSATTAG